MYKKISGIYGIRHKESGKIYVGSAVNILQRFALHRSRLKLQQHHSILLQRAYNKYSINAFEFVILEEVPDKTNLIEREQYWLDLYKSYLPENGYNICRIAGNTLGWVPSDKTRALWVQQRTGKKLKPESIEKIRQASSGRKYPERAKAIMGKNNPRYGKKHTFEAKEKMRQAALSRIHQRDLRTGRFISITLIP